MTLISIETSSQSCSLAVTIDGHCRLHFAQWDKANHAKDLPVFVEQCVSQMQEQGWQADAVALSRGPGSYTGLRIGASMAKGLCYGWHIPLIPVDTLQVMAVAVEQSVEENALLCPMLDARRMEVYTALYHPRSLERIGDVVAKVIDSETFSDLRKDHTLYLFGPGAQKCKTVLQDNHIRYIDDIKPDARWVGLLAEKQHTSLLNDKQMAYFEPFYLKEFVPAPSHIKGLE